VRNASLAHRYKETNPLLKFKDRSDHPATPTEQNPFYSCYQPEEKPTCVCKCIGRCNIFINNITIKISNIFTMYKLKLIEKLKYVKLLPGLIMTVAITTLFSNLISYEANVKVALIVGGSILVSLLVIYIEFCSFRTEGLCSQVCHCWWGVVLSGFTFAINQYRVWSYDDRDRLTDMLLATSTLMKCCCELLDRCASNIFYTSSMLFKRELYMVVGFVGIGFLFLDNQTSFVLVLVSISSIFVISNLRMKCTLSYPYLLFFAAISGIAIYDNMHLKMNQVALVCYHVYLIFGSSADFYFSPLSAIERWSSTFWLSWCKQILIIVIVILIEAFFSLSAFYVVFIHPEFELVIMLPVLSLVFIVWVTAHFSYFSSEITLAGRISDCQTFYRNILPANNGITDIANIMSRKGVRQLCMIGQQTVSCALLSTLLFGGLSWRRENAFYPAIMLLVVGFECLCFGRNRELAVKLGGTCAALAIISPTTVANPNSVVTILPVNSEKKQNERATNLMSYLHRLFQTYLIEVLGVEYSTNEVVQSVQEKINNLFKKTHHINDLKFDTYLFYYSGLTLQDGSLVFSGNGTISPDQLIQTWQQYCGSLCHSTNGKSFSRLLLVLDIANPQPWLRIVKSLRHDYVAVQTCYFQKPDNNVHKIQIDQDIDLVNPPNKTIYEPGDFTPLWINWNINVKVPSNQDLWYQDTTVKPLYSVSRRWTDFSMRSPYNSGQEDLSHSVLCRPCLSASTSCSRKLSLIRMLGAPGRRYRRLKMRWFPPQVLDTGHGFKLVCT